MAVAESFDVVVVYALPEAQRLLTVRVEAGTTLGQAIRRSGILQEFPEIDLRHSRLGIYGRLAAAADAAKPGDRIEIYRPLSVDPKAIRRLRAAARSRKTSS